MAAASLILILTLTTNISEVLGHVLRARLQCDALRNSSFYTTSHTAGALYGGEGDITSLVRYLNSIPPSGPAMGRHQTSRAP